MKEAPNSLTIGIEATANILKPVTRFIGETVVLFAMNGKFGRFIQDIVWTSRARQYSH